MRPKELRRIVQDRREPPPWPGQCNHDRFMSKIGIQNAADFSSRQANFSGQIQGITRRHDIVLRPVNQQHRRGMTIHETHRLYVLRRIFIARLHIENQPILRVRHEIIWT